MIHWLRNRRKPKRKLVLEILEAHGSLTAIDIALRSMGRLRNRKVYSPLLNLENNGFITRYNHNGMEVMYQISREGRLALAESCAS